MKSVRGPSSREIAARMQGRIDSSDSQTLFAQRARTRGTMRARTGKQRPRERLNRSLYSTLMRSDSPGDFHRRSHFRTVRRRVASEDRSGCSINGKIQEVFDVSPIARSERKRKQLIRGSPGERRVFAALGLAIYFNGHERD